MENVTFSRENVADFMKTMARPAGGLGCPGHPRRRAAGYFKGTERRLSLAGIIPSLAGFY
jgi:hypothetical protein